MAGRFESRLKELNIELPKPGAPAGAYVPTVQTGNLLYISGQLPIIDGKTVCTGIVGQAVTVEQANKAARVCAMNILSLIRDSAGSLDRVHRVVRLAGFVASGPEFTDHPAVMNGASELMLEVFGEAGKHARMALGSSSLPRGASVEIEALIELTP